MSLLIQLFLPLQYGVLSVLDKIYHHYISITLVNSMITVKNPTHWHIITVLLIQKEMKAYASPDMLQHLPEGKKKTGLIIRKLQDALLAVECISMLFTDQCGFMS